MSTSVVKEEKKKRTLVLKSSSRATNVSGAHGVKQSFKHTNSVLFSTSRRSLTLGVGSKVLEKSTTQTPRPAVRVFDKENNDVTPLPLYQADPGAAQAKASRFLTEEMFAGSASDQTTTIGSFSQAHSRSGLWSSRISSSSTLGSVTEEIEDIFAKRDLPISFPVLKKKKDPVEECQTEEMLDEKKVVGLSETDTFSLLDIPSTSVSVDADDAKAVIESNNQYVELCRSKAGYDKYVDRWMETVHGALKNKHVQCDRVFLVDAAVTVTPWDMYDTFCGTKQEEAAVRPEPEKPAYVEAALDSSRAASRSLSVDSTVSTVSVSSSLRELEAIDSSGKTEADMQLIMMSEEFQHSLLVMERSILLNRFQPLLSAYRQLPVLQEPDSPERPEAEENIDGDTESAHRRPALQSLWVFSCELSRGRRISSMTWNKKYPDLLAVGYCESESGNQKPGLVCCWSLKNPTWPERIIHCDSPVTTLDFSASSPGQLAVGMHDGSIAIYNMQSQDTMSRFISTRECLNQHLGPVWQLKWTQQELSLTGDENEEALISVSADGRVSKWFVFNTGLDCIDLMKIKRIVNIKNKAGMSSAVKTTESVLSSLTPGLCFDFHPTDSSIYMIGTWEGLIHKCSCTNTQQYLDTYRKHYCPVNCITWSPLNPDVFLSCSSDWTIQLWKQDHTNPVLGFTCAQKAVRDIKWSPKWATVFGAINDGQLEIWDLNASLLDPVVVKPAAPGVTMTSLLFTPKSNCVVVGDSVGQVTVYQLENLKVGESNQVEVVEELLLSAASR
ncbi:dynein axonemal intermediate chain 4 [Parambassis ranga]|uniref:Dynein axonemal intermediate chain 4 n=1 Tax=Parambassis ranga TaxID=210632 RepID=A0A6P7K195_9TELE|nr:WD repeat-containing protein 78 [Parambassis ranga]